MRRVFGSRASQLVVYWIRQYFQGVLPPATLASDEAVRRFVIFPGSGGVKRQIEDPEQRLGGESIADALARAEEAAAE